MKKIFAMILAAAMVFAVTACSVESEKGAEGILLNDTRSNLAASAIWKTDEINWNQDDSGFAGVDFYNGSYNGIPLAMHVAENWSVNDFLEYMGCSQVDVELRYRGLDFYWYRSNLYQMQCLTFSYEKDGKTNYITTPFDGESDISYMDDLLNLFPAEPIETFTDAFGAALPA